MALLAHFFWAFFAPAGKILLQWWPEWTLNAVRMMIATLVVMIFYGREESTYGLKALLVDKHLIILGVVGIGMTFGLYIASLAYIEATAAGVLIFLAPFMTAILARIFLGEIAGWALYTAATVALIGAYLTLFGATREGFELVGTALGLGLVLNILSVFLWAIYTVHLKVVAVRYTVGRLTVATFVAATVFFIVNALIFDLGRTGVVWAGALRWDALLWMLYYALFPSAAAYLLYAASIGRVGAGPISLLLGFELLVTSILAHLLLGERFPPIRILGLVITMTAVVWFVWMRTRGTWRSRLRRRTTA
jgi:drug/metabolite transporter (DMT)-like permease